MADATWTTWQEQKNMGLTEEDIVRSSLLAKSNTQEKLGLVSWGGYVFHIYKELVEKHSIDLSEYPIPGRDTLGYRVQNKINKPTEVVLDVMMVTTGTVSMKNLFSADYSKFDFFSMDTLVRAADVLPWIYYPLNIGGIMDKLKDAMYKGWALPYNGKYGRIKNMIITSIEAIDNEKTVYGCPLKIHLKEVLGINHRAYKTSTAQAPVCKLVSTVSQRS